MDDNSKQTNKSHYIAKGSSTESRKTRKTWMEASDNICLQNTGHENLSLPFDWILHQRRNKMKTFYFKNLIVGSHLTDRNRSQIFVDVINGWYLFEMACLRKIEEVTRRDRIRNQKIFNRLNIKTVIIDRIRNKRLRYFGHLNSMKNERYP